MRTGYMWKTAFCSLGGDFRKSKAECTQVLDDLDFRKSPPRKQNSYFPHISGRSSIRAGRTFRASEGQSRGV